MYKSSMWLVVMSILSTHCYAMQPALYQEYLYVMDEEQGIQPPAITFLYNQNQYQSDESVLESKKKPLKFKRTKSGNFVNCSSAVAQPPNPQQVSTPHFQDEDPEPPTQFRIHSSPEDSSSSYSSASSSSSSSSGKSPLNWPDLLKEHNDEDGISLLPAARPATSYTLSLYDEIQAEVISFVGATRSDVLKHYLEYYIHNAETDVSQVLQSHLYGKTSLGAIRENDSLFEVMCNAGGGLCKHREMSFSRKSLIVQLFAHYMVDHDRSGKWQSKISQLLVPCYDVQRDHEIESSSASPKRRREDDEQKTSVFDSGVAVSSVSEVDYVVDKELAGALSGACNEQPVPISSDSITHGSLRGSFPSFSQFVFEENDNSTLPRLGSWADDLMNYTDTQSYYCLVAFDSVSEQHLAFRSSNKRALIQNYLNYVFMHHGVLDYTIFKSSLLKIDKAPINQKEDGSYVAKCCELDCGYLEGHETTDVVTIKMYIHAVVYHKKDTDLYEMLCERIKENFAEAYNALKGVTNA